LQIDVLQHGRRVSVRERHVLKAQRYRHASACRSASRLRRITVK
jgi:hypothetical protein